LGYNLPLPCYTGLSGIVKSWTDGRWVVSLQKYSNHDSAKIETQIEVLSEQFGEWILGISPQAKEVVASNNSSTSTTDGVPF